MANRRTTTPREWIGRLWGTLRPRRSDRDLRMLGVAFAIAALTSLVFGVLPDLHASRTQSLQAMGPRGGGSGRDESRIRAALVVGQIVMATVLLVGAGLLIRSFVRLSAVERGYDPSHALAFQLVLPPDYSVARKTETIEAVLERLRATPTVGRAASILRRAARRVRRCCG